MFVYVFALRTCCGYVHVGGYGKKENSKIIKHCKGNMFKKEDEEKEKITPFLS